MASAAFGQAPAADLDALLQPFFAADGPAKAARVSDSIGAATPEFDRLYDRLRRGHTYAPQPAGVREYETIVNGALLQNTLDVPPEYDPSKAWPLRVQLHGGVGRM